MFAQLDERPKETTPSQIKNCGHEQQLRHLTMRVSTLEQDKQRLVKKANQLECELK
jgi:hypothetical protein